MTEAEIRVMQLQTMECQGLPGATGSWQKQGENLYQSLQREHGPTGTLILDFWPPELQEYTFLSF